MYDEALGKVGDFLRIYVQYFLLLSFLLVISLVSGCGGTDEDPDPLNFSAAPSSPDKWEVGHGDLKHYVGDPHRTPEGSEYLFNDIGRYPDIIKNTEYSEPTGKWMLSDKGKFGYGMTDGFQEADSTYTASLINPHEGSEPLHRDVRIQLTERDENLKRKKLITEHIRFVDDIQGHVDIYSDVLPNKPHAIYFLSMEILDDVGHVEDTLVSVIYVAPKDVNATLSLDQDVYNQTDSKATLTLHNLGPTFLSLGTYYTIEKMVEDTWRVVPLALVFTDIGIFLQIDQSYDQTIDLSQLKPGQYRVVKEFHVQGIASAETLAIPFTIE